MRKRLSVIIKGILLFILLMIVTVYKDFAIADIIKLLVITLSGIKWVYYIKHDNRYQYFRKSFICILLYWIIIVIELLIEKQVNTILFMFMTAAVWIVALAISFKAGCDFLAVINKHYPNVMKSYYSSKDYRNKEKTLEKELLRIKEDAPVNVSEAIEKREMIKPIAYFHIEMIILTTVALWPSYFSK